MGKKLNRKYNIESIHIVFTEITRKLDKLINSVSFMRNFTALVEYVFFGGKLKTVSYRITALTGGRSALWKRPRLVPFLFPSWKRFTVCMKILMSFFFKCILSLVSAACGVLHSWNGLLKNWIRTRREFYSTIQVWSALGMFHATKRNFRVQVLASKRSTFEQF